MSDKPIKEEGGWVSLAVLGVIACMLLPVPSYLLSSLLVVNLAAALLLLVMALTIEEPLQFGIFPTLLLLTTLLDLSLNISATRLILLNGDAGGVVHAFGTLMAGSSPLVGLVIFAILTVVQFVVITKGAERVAEVAARFTLDAMPGKQMSIDADLSAGLITNTEAKARRAAVESESDFYGAMDGASKFAKGNVIASIIILFINLLGGLVAGMVAGRMSFAQVLTHYTLLTIGEGLAAQMPALLISTATGIMVTRVASASGVGASLGRQFLAQPKSLRTVGGVLLALGVTGFFTELPSIPFLVVGGLLIALAGMGDEAARTRVKEDAQAAIPGKAQTEENAVAALEAAPLELVLGLSLVPLVDPKRGAGIAKRLTLVRQNLSREFGVPLPEVRVRDGVQLPPRSYAIHVRGVEMARGDIFPNHWLAMNLPVGVDSEHLGGVDGLEPAFGIPARWIPEASRPAAMSMGATLVDAGSVLVTHLTETMRRSMGALLSRREVVLLVEQLRKKTPSLVEEVVPGLLSLGEVQKVMSLMLEEQVALTDLPTFFEALSLAARNSKDPEVLAEACRGGLGRALCSRLADGRHVVQAVALDPRIEEAIENADKQPLNPEKTRRLKEHLQQAVLTLMARTRHAVLLTSPKARPMLAHLTERFDPRPWVLSTREVLPPFEVKTAAQVGWD